jgi:ATP-dependent DNA ligase
VRPKFQGDVFFQFIQPCNPVTAKSVPAGDDWLHEPKLDGYRLQVAKEGHGVRLYSRRGHDWSKRLAVLAEALRLSHVAAGAARPPILSVTCNHAPGVVQ